MTKEIPLSKQQRSNSRNAGLVALVDDDYELLNQWNWTAVSTHHRNGGYAMRIEGGKTILMHRQILDAPEGAEVDHINGAGLDNRRSNLRFATRQQGQANRRVFKSDRSGYKGVHFDKQLGRWYLAHILIVLKKPRGCTIIWLELCLASTLRPILTSRRTSDSI